MTELRQVTVVTREGFPIFVFVSPQRARETVERLNRETPDRPYQLNLFAIAG